MSRQHTAQSKWSWWCYHQISLSRLLDSWDFIRFETSNSKIYYNNNNIILYYMSRKISKKSIYNCDTHTHTSHHMLSLWMLCRDICGLSLVFFVDVSIFGTDIKLLQQPHRRTYNIVKSLGLAENWIFPLWLLLLSLLLKIRRYVKDISWPSRNRKCIWFKQIKVCKWILFNGHFDISRSNWFRFISISIQLNWIVKSVDDFSSDCVSYILSYSPVWAELFF